MDRDTEDILVVMALVGLTVFITWDAPLWARTLIALVWILLLIAQGYKHKFSFLDD